MWTRDKIRSERDKYVSKSLSISRGELVIKKAKVTYLEDCQGTRFLDTLNNVSHVGHCNARVVKASCRQMKLLNTNSRYLHPLLPLYSLFLLSSSSHFSF